MISGYAAEPLPAGAVEPALNAVNVHDAAALTRRIRTALDKISPRPRRIALVLPDTVAKVSLIRFEKVPAKVQDLDQLIRWQVRKAAPFRIEDAQVSWVPGVALDGGGREFVVTVARQRRDRRATSRRAKRPGRTPGVVDLASFNLMNAVLAATPTARRATGCSSTSAPTTRRSPSCAGPTSCSSATAARPGRRSSRTSFIRPSMYHEDRLGGGGFARVVLTGAALRGPDQADWIRREHRRAPRHRDRIARLPHRGAHSGSHQRGPRAARRAGAGARRPPAREDRVMQAEGPGSGFEDGRLVLRTNLSTRPFYNERVVHLLHRPGGRDRPGDHGVQCREGRRSVATEHRSLDASRARSDRERTRLRREAVRIRKGIDPKELTVVAAAAREANALIDQRTFSWTAFFNHLEATLPPDVMLVSVRPSIDRGATRVSMVVLGRTPEDIDEFIEKLEATGAFERSSLDRWTRPTRG